MRAAIVGKGKRGAVAIMEKELFFTIVIVWTCLAVLIFPLLLRITAPYGRHSQTGWGPMIDNRLGWILMELPALLVFLGFYLQNGIPVEPFARVAGVLWVAHYFHRAILFPLGLKTQGKKMPVLIMAAAICFNLMNGFINGYWLGFFAPERGMEWLMSLPFIVGLLLFATGFVINRYHDRLLIRLRKTSQGGYSIPKGALFRYVSCPNYFGEIVEWGGYVLLTWGLPSVSFLLWTFVNLVPRALDHHRWYRSHFDDYPPERKAVIPFLL